MEYETRDLFRYLDLIRRHKSVILGCVLAAGIASAVISCFFLPTLYRGTVKLMTKSVSDKFTVLPDTIDAYVALFQEDEVVNRAVGRAREEGAVTDLSASELRRMGSLREIRDVSMFELRVDSADPGAAASLANIWADLFVAEAAKVAAKLRADARKIAADEILVAEEKLKKSQGELNEFCAEHYVREPEPTLGTIPVRTLTLERQRIESLADAIEQYEKKASALSLLDKEVGSFLAANKDYAGSNEKAAVDDALFLASLYARYTSILAESGHPVNVDLPAQFIDHQKSALFVAVQRTAARLSTIRKLLESEQDALKSELAELQKQLPTNEARLQELSRGVNNAGIELQEANRRLSRIMEDYAILSSDPIVILSRAYVPSSPVAPRKLVNIVVASAFGLVVGLGIAFLAEYAARQAK